MLILKTTEKVNLSSLGWNYVTLDTPFDYNSGNFEILFDDGTRVLLKSKTQLIEEGIEMIDSCNKSVKIASKHIYSIAKNGVIVIRVGRDLKKGNFKRK